MSIHATAVAIDGEALLIVGLSRSGKSRLAVSLIAKATASRPIRLIGDDRILLRENGARVVARPHSRIAGFIERRGLGIVAMDWVAEAPVAGIVDLQGARRAHLTHTCGGKWVDAVGSDDGEGRELSCRLASVSPRLALASAEADPDRVLAWWDARAAATSHLAQKRCHADRTCAKD